MKKGKNVSKMIAAILIGSLLMPSTVTYASGDSDDLFSSEENTAEAHGKVIHINKDIIAHGTNKKNEQKAEETDRAKKIKAPSKEKVVINENVMKRKANIQKQIAEIRKARRRYKESKKLKETVEAFYQKIGTTEEEVAAALSAKKKTGKELNATVEDKNKKELLLALSKEIEDSYVAEVANTYTFDLELHAKKIVENVELLDLKSYLDKYRKASKNDTRSIAKLQKESNTLHEVRKFDPKNLLIKSHVTKDEMQKILSGTELSDCAAYFVECEETYGVNAIFIAGIAIHESGWGTSRRAREDHNLTGYGVTSDEAKGINENTRRSGLLRTAKCLKESYLTKGSKFYHGTSVSAINVKYCVGDTWASSVTKAGYELIERIGDLRGYRKE